MAAVKRCKQCGILKDAEAFRKYTYSKTNETGGRFSTCRSCEAINSKYAKLKATVDKGLVANPVAYDERVFQEAQQDLAVIEELYKTLESHGFHTPLSRNVKETTKTVVDSAIEKLQSFYLDMPAAKTVAPIPTEKSVDIPDELNHWLTENSDTWKEKGMSPEFLQETIYESLKAKYRPQIGMDQEKFIPIYDDTYKEILNNILRKFDDYEEEMEMSDDVT